MYCRMCGKWIEDIDRHCRFCGAATGYMKITADADKMAEITEEIVYNPPYDNGHEQDEIKSIADQETSESEQSVENEAASADVLSERETEQYKNQQEELSGSNRLEDLEFTWDIHEFPKVKKTEEIEFDWRLEELKEKDQTEQALKEGIGELEINEPYEETIDITFEERPSAKTIEVETEEWLFRDINDDIQHNEGFSIDKFFTFNKKNEEFQKLLDMEYEKYNRYPATKNTDIPIENTGTQEIVATEEIESGITEIVVPEEIESSITEIVVPEEIESSITEIVATEEIESSITEIVAPEEIEPSIGELETTGASVAEFALGTETEEATPETETEEAANEQQEPETVHEEEIKTPQVPKASYWEKISQATALLFGEGLIKDNETIKKNLELKEAGGHNIAEPELEPELEAIAEKSIQIDTTSADTFEPEITDSVTDSNQEVELDHTDSTAAETAEDEGELDFTDHTATETDPTATEPDHTDTDTATNTEADTTADSVRPHPSYRAAELVQPDFISMEAFFARADLTNVAGEHARGELQHGSYIQEEDEAHSFWERNRSRIIIIAILAIILTFEISILGIRHFAGESQAAQAINRAQTSITETVMGFADKISGIFGGKDTDNSRGNNTALTNAGVQSTTPENITEGQQNTAQTSTAPDPKPSADKAALVASMLGNNVNIEKVAANNNLVFKKGRDYGVNDLNHSKPIENNIWLTSENGAVTYYDQAVVGTIIAFDSQWIDYVNGNNKAILELLKKDSKAYNNTVNFSKIGKIKEKFKTLELGEIRKGSNGFYIWTHEEMQITEKGTAYLKKYNWIYYLEAVDGKMTVVNYIKY